MSRKNGGIIGPANTPVGGFLVGSAGGVWRMNDVANFVSNSQWPKAPENIENSCRFDDGSNDNFTRTQDDGNKRTWTTSWWVKRTNLGINTTMWDAGTSGGNNYSPIFFQSDDTIRFYEVVGGSLQSFNFITNAKFRDTAAWYHIVYRVDTTQSTQSDRVRLYINGTQITSFSTSAYPAQNYDTTKNNSSYRTTIGTAADNDGNDLDAYLAEFVHVDGQSLEPTSFGETDSTTGIWKPKKIGQFASAGDNSFYLNFKDSSNLGKDESGLSNNFTVNNLTSIDQSTDTCVENFATLNSLNGNNYAGLTFSEGNLSIATTAGQYAPGLSTIGFNTGKWYAEFKLTSSTNWALVGVTGQVATATNYSIGHGTTGYGYAGGSSATGQQLNNNNLSSYGDTYSNGDIIGIALDLDNHKLYFHKNGTYQNSGVPTSGSTGTGAISISTSPDTGFYHMGVGNYSGTQTPSWSANFGNPPFSISSGNSDANGHGNFEYSVPSGYYALNTSNLNTYG